MKFLVLSKRIGLFFEDVPRLRHSSRMGNLDTMAKQREAPTRTKMALSKRRKRGDERSRKETRILENCCCRPTCLRKIENSLTERDPTKNEEEKKRRERKRRFYLVRTEPPSSDWLGIDGCLSKKKKISLSNSSV